MEQITATRATQDQAWIDQNKLIDWMAAPGMADYVNALVSGQKLADGGHWALYANRKFVKPLSEKLGRPLSLVSFGCGDGHIEQSLIAEFGWPINKVLGLEYDSLLRKGLLDRFHALPGVECRAEFFDFNHVNSFETDETFDVIFCCHALHHAFGLEELLPYINTKLRPDGIFVGIEYLGPSRFQVDHEVRPILEQLFALLPASMRRNLSHEGREDQQFAVATIAEVAKADPSESVRSSDLRTLLLASFPVIEIQPMGGTLLRWLLQNRAGNLRSDIEEHRTIAGLLQFIEGSLIRTKQIQSDDLFFVLGKSDRLG